MCFYNFHFSFWWSVKFPQHNINQSETWIGGFQLSVELYVFGIQFHCQFWTINSCSWLVYTLPRKFDTLSKRQVKMIKTLILWWKRTFILNSLTDLWCSKFQTLERPRNFEVVSFWSLEKWNFGNYRHVVTTFLHCSFSR